MMDVVLNWDLCLKVSSRDDVGIIRKFTMESTSSVFIQKSPIDICPEPQTIEQGLTP